MKSSFTAEQLNLFTELHGRELAKLIESTDPADYATRVPSTWLDLVARPSSSSIHAMWKGAIAHLPRFVDYLARSVDGAAVIEVDGFPVLLLALPNWREKDEELSPGFCWVGTPTDAARIDEFVSEVGPIPPALDHLWRVANFITTKERSTLCSLDPSTRTITEAPVVLSALPDPSVPQDIYECLQIAVLNHQMVTCMTRPPGQRRWNDFLVRRFRQTHSLTSAVHTNLDDRLANWTFLDWE